MDKEGLEAMATREPQYRGTEIPAPIRWGEPSPPKVTLYQRARIVVAAGVGAVLLVVAVIDLLF